MGCVFSSTDHVKSSSQALPASSNHSVVSSQRNEVLQPEVNEDPERPIEASNNLETKTDVLSPIQNAPSFCLNPGASLKSEEDSKRSENDAKPSPDIDIIPVVVAEADIIELKTVLGSNTGQETEFKENNYIMVVFLKSDTGLKSIENSIRFGSDARTIQLISTPEIDKQCDLIISKEAETVEASVPEAADTCDISSSNLDIEKDAENDIVENLGDEKQTTSTGTKKHKNKRKNKNKH